MPLAVSNKGKMQFPIYSKPTAVQNIRWYDASNLHSAWRTNVLTVGKLGIQIRLLSCFNCSI